MLITQLKNKEDLAGVVKGKVFIINCHGCKEVRFPEKEVSELQKELQAAGKVTGILTTDYICNPENLKLRLTYRQKEIDAARPQIERLATHGTAEERRVARRWLALDDKTRQAKRRA